MQARSTLVSAALVAVMALAGCASKDDTDGGATAEPTSTPTASDGSPTLPTEPADPTGIVVEVTISGNDVTPNGKRVEVGLGDDVTFAITADAAGELHFHSKPEQSIHFPAGTSTHTVKFTRPGVVEVESHHPEKVIVLLEVR